MTPSDSKADNKGQIGFLNQASDESLLQEKGQPSGAVLTEVTTTLSAAGTSTAPTASAAATAPTSVAKSSAQLVALSQEMSSEGKYSAFGSRIDPAALEQLQNQPGEEEKGRDRLESFWLPRILVANLTPHAGRKTVLEALAAAYRVRFYEHEKKSSVPTVMPFLCGYGRGAADYETLRFATGVTPLVLDPNLASSETLVWMLCRYAQEAKLALLDAGACLFDTPLMGKQAQLDEGMGRSPARASADHLARLVQTPVLLVADASSTDVQLLALLKGLLTYARPPVIRGLILNRCHAKRYERLADQIQNELNLAVLGYLPEHPHFQRDFLKEAPGSEKRRWSRIYRLQNLADTMEESVDLDRLYTIAERSSTLPSELPRALFRIQSEIGAKPQTFRLAVAKDQAFNGINESDLDLFRDLGADVCFFSPLEETSLPSNVDGIYLCAQDLGAYIELLSQNSSMRRSLLYAIGTQGIPTIAEEDAYVYLSARVKDPQLGSRSLCGIYPDEMPWPHGESEAEAWGERMYVRLTSMKEHLLAPKHAPIEALLRAGRTGLTGHGPFLMRAEGEDLKTYVGAATESLFAAPIKIDFLGQAELALRFAKACQAQAKKRIQEQQLSQTRTDLFWR